MSQTDRIEKKIFLRAPRAHVWRALTSSAEFSEWFGLALVGEFRAGQAIRGKKANYPDVDIELVVDRIDPEHLFSFRWRPYAIDPKVDYSHEPMNLVRFELSEAEGGTALVVTESGFDGLSDLRRATALRMNEQGWSMQVENIKRHVEAKS